MPVAELSAVISIIDGCGVLQSAQGTKGRECAVPERGGQRAGQQCLLSLHSGSFVCAGRPGMTANLLCMCVSYRNLGKDDFVTLSLE